jgi:transposase
MYSDTSIERMVCMQEGKPEQQQSQGSRRRKFSEEFKKDAVEMVQRSGQAIAEVAAELGIYDSTLGIWIRARQVDEGEREGLRTEERQRLHELERQNAELGQERDLLKRIVAFPLKESTS